MYVCLNTHFLCAGETFLPSSALNFPLWPQHERRCWLTCVGVRAHPLCPPHPPSPLYWWISVDGEQMGDEWLCCSADDHVRPSPGTRGRHSHFSVTMVLILIQVLVLFVQHFNYRWNCEPLFIFLWVIFRSKNTKYSRYTWSRYMSTYESGGWAADQSGSSSAQGLDLDPVSLRRRILGIFISGNGVINILELPGAGGYSDLRGIAGIFCGVKVVGSVPLQLTCRCVPEHATGPDDTTWKCWTFDNESSWLCLHDLCIPAVTRNFCVLKWKNLH